MWWLKSDSTKIKLTYLLSYVLGIGFLDQIIKYFSLNFKDSPVSVGPIDFVWYENPGIAFSINLSLPIAIVLASITLIILLWLFFKAKKSLNYYQLGLVLIIAGGLSNLLDKIFFGFVRDMVAISILPVFNLADLSILAGIILIIVEWSREKTT
ncbi:MAG: signal peptidase II [Patescibacteria group bacterium]|nr:signal peptidase II [Patescibacteria group bacterium]